jgi:thiopurine S-methyltransferase
MRARYVREVYDKLPSGCRGLLITLEYPQQEKAGPPFSVAEDEVRALFEGEWLVTRLERRDVLKEQPSFQAEGVSALETVVYRLDQC